MLPLDCTYTCLTQAAHNTGKLQKKPGVACKCEFFVSVSLPCVTQICRPQHTTRNSATWFQQTHQAVFCASSRSNMHVGAQRLYVTQVAHNIHTLATKKVWFGFSLYTGVITVCVPLPSLTKDNVLVLLIASISFAGISGTLDSMVPQVPLPAPIPTPTLAPQPPLSLQESQLRQLASMLGSANMAALQNMILPTAAAPSAPDTTGR